MNRNIDHNRGAAAEPAYRLQVLGGLALTTADGRAIELPTRKSALLLAYLAVPAAVTHARDKLADLLWPLSGQDQARGSLRQALAALRKQLGSDAIEGARDQIRLRSGIIRVDLDAIADLADGRVAPMQPDPSIGSLGTFLDGVAADGEALGDWLIFERTRSCALLQGALERTIDALSSSRRYADAIATVERLVALDPLREQSHRVLMQTLVDAGERPKALDRFRKLQALLKAELGVAPSPQSIALAREIQSDDVTAKASAGPDDAREVLPTLAEGRRTGARRIVVAVLPFQCLSPEEDLAAFVDGFSSDLVMSLSRVPEFSVIAWQSSARVSGRTVDAAQSATELDADYALTGNIRHGDGRIRIGAQLVAATTRTWVWADRYDLDAANALSAEDRIVAGIIGAVDAGVRRAEREYARTKPLANLDAWSLYHRGMWHMYRFTREDVAAAEQLFAAALLKDPGAGPPHAGWAYACIVKALWMFTPDPRGAIAEGLSHAREAVARDELDAHAHTVLGRLFVMSGALDRGIEHLQRAIELNPSLAHAYYGLGHALYVSSEPSKALGPLATALRLSPKDPLASMFLTMAAFCHLMLDDLAAAEAAARRARNLLSREIWSRLALAATLQIRGAASEARGAVLEAREIEPDLNMARFAPLVQYIPATMRNRVLAALAEAGLPVA